MIKTTSKIKKSLKLQKQSLSLEKISLSLQKDSLKKLSLKNEKTESKNDKKSTVKNKTRELNKSRMKKEMKVHKKKIQKSSSAKVRKVERAWVELFEKCYDSKYRISVQESSMLKKLVQITPEEDLYSTMISIFWVYLNDEWFQEKELVPSLTDFVKKFDKYKSRGARIKKYISLNGDRKRWWIINEAKIPEEELKNEKFKDVLKVSKEKKYVVVYRVNDGVVAKESIGRSYD